MRLAVEITADQENIGGPCHPGQGSPGPPPVHDSATAPRLPAVDAVTSSTPSQAVVIGAETEQAVRLAHLRLHRHRQPRAGRGRVRPGPVVGASTSPASLHRGPRWGSPRASRSSTCSRRLIRADAQKPFQQGGSGTPAPPKPCPLSQSQRCHSKHRRISAGTPRERVSNGEPGRGLQIFPGAVTGGIGQHLGADGHSACLRLAGRARATRPASLALNVSQISGPLLPTVRRSRASASVVKVVGGGAKAASSPRGLLGGRGFSLAARVVLIYAFTQWGLAALALLWPMWKIAFSGWRSPRRCWIGLGGAPARNVLAGGEVVIREQRSPMRSR